MQKKPIHVLLVEDSPSDARLQRHRFSRLDKDGWQLIEVELLSDAIHCCGDLPIDIVLLDLDLPDSDRLETVKEFRAAIPDIPIVVLTGVNNEDLALNAMAQGAQDYLVKDEITIPLLVRTIHYAIERGQILKQLQDSERRFRGIFNQTFQFMALLTPAGTLLEINQTALEFSGTHPEDCVGLPLWELSCWNYSPKIQQWLQTAVSQAARGDFVREEVQVRSAGDVMVWIDFSLKPLKDETGNVVLLIEEGRDISDVYDELRLRKQAETELLKALERERELNQLKMKFVSAVSQGFRTPLTTISSSKSLLERYCQDCMDEKKRKHFQRIQAATNQMVHLLDDVLLLGKADLSNLTFQPAPIDLLSFCHHLIEEIQSNVGSVYRITFTHHGECTHGCMDQNLLQTILTHLLTNAMDYSPPGETIKFELSCQDQVVTFRIHDQGVRILPADFSQLLESFPNLTQGETIPDIGLGLSLVKKSVDLHGGQIEVDSQADVGTTFTVILPLKNKLSLI